nr:hypothetical protein BaRGS_002468 [Batillaria attramentaria]
MREQQYLHRKLEELEGRSPHVNQLENLFTNPKAENNLVAAPSRQENGLAALEMTANIFKPITQGMLRLEHSLSYSDSDIQGRHAAHAHAMAQLYKEPKQANTEHRNSPNSSRNKGVAKAENMRSIRSI